MGVTVPESAFRFRIDHLRATFAAIKFLLLEPLLSELPDLNLSGIDWVLVGGESGPGARSMDLEWVRSIRDQCVSAGVPFFFKQWGRITNNPDPNDPTAKRHRRGIGGRMLDGRTWDEMPRPAKASPVTVDGAAEPEPAEHLVACEKADTREHHSQRRKLSRKRWRMISSCPGLTAATIILAALYTLARCLWVRDLPTLLAEVAIMGVLLVASSSLHRRLVRPVES